MFVATNRLQVKPGSGSDLEDRFSRRGGVEQQPGFLGFELWKLDGAEDFEEYLVVTHWESEEAHVQWTHSEAFRQSHSGIRGDFFLGPPEFKKYAVRLRSAPEGAKEGSPSP
ncbi:MAG: antibiotic biosynthesis monooxygenase family protein [Dehalococcoidia bacterium]